MCFQGLVIVDFTNSNYPRLEIIGLVVSGSPVKTVEFPEKRDSRDGDMTEFPENRDSVVKGLTLSPHYPGFPGTRSCRPFTFTAECSFDCL